MTADKKEVWPLAWPESWPRTRPQDRRPMSAWKRTATQYRDALATELERLGSPMSLISTNVPLSVRGTLSAGIEPLDVGVAAYFSRKLKEDFSWQDALDIHDPAPTEEQVQSAFKRLARQFHPDTGTGGDLAMFQSVAKHRDNALRWIHRKSNQQFDQVIACDQFKEVRLNMAAIVMTIKAIRQIERCGATSLLDRVFKGFSALPERAGADAVGVGVR